MHFLLRAGARALCNRILFLSDISVLFLTNLVFNYLISGSRCSLFLPTFSTVGTFVFQSLLPQVEMAALHSFNQSGIE